MNIYPSALKQPGYIPDLSLTDLGADLYLANPRPMGVITRAVVAYYPNIKENYRCVSVGRDESVGPLFAETKDLGIGFGVYAYFLQNKVQQQVDEFLSVCTDNGLFKDNKWQCTYPPYLDVEVERPDHIPNPKPKGYIPFLGPVKWAAQVHEWLEKVESVLKVRPEIYTARAQWKWLCTEDAAGNYTAPAWTSGYRFWLKFYAFEPFVESTKQIPNSMLPTGVSRSQVTLWQYEQEGRSRGGEYNDLNVLTDVGMLLYGSIDPQPQSAFSQLVAVYDGEKVKMREE